jgi:hypothetical protein
MSNREYFRIDEPRVISEALDGELVLVQFESGCYYSIRGVGADICQLLSAGWSLEHAIDRIVQHHNLPKARIEADVRSFVLQLVTEKLLVETGAPQLAASAILLASTEYAQPSFEKFDDMADQLLLDPIHDIDETGWPAKRAG